DLSFPSSEVMGMDGNGNTAYGGLRQDLGFQMDVGAPIGHSIVRVGTALTVFKIGDFGGGQCRIFIIVATGMQEDSQKGNNCQRFEICFHCTSVFGVKLYWIIIKL